jgi:tRNA threonylcarbamoyladenosine biosynthesis protein TsaE
MPIIDANSLEIFSRSPEQTRRVGMRMGGLLRTGDVLCLQGELGSGKTTLVQGLALGWGSLEPVSSPTFVLVNIYHRPDATGLFHMDAFRLEDVRAAEELDIDDMLAQGPLIIEWPEKMIPILPKERLLVRLSYQGEEHRSMLFSAFGERCLHLLTEFQQLVFGGV